MELKFYEILATHYDDIFPLSGNTLSFLSEGLEPEAKVLDAACGTGTYAIALAGKGFQTVGVDIDESMVAIAEAKAVMLDADADFIVSDMMDIDLVCTDEMDMIFCIGNSLVHLRDRKQALDFIKICHGLLKPGGSLILQIVNYDRILDESLTSLPTIEVKEKDITFVRNYKLDPDTMKIEFRSKLRVGSEEAGSSVMLLPLRKSELEDMLESAGFKSIESFGGFDGSPWDKSKLPLVMRAKKA